MAEDIQGQLYKQLSEKYDFGDETAFRNALRSKEGAKYIYDTATQGGYDLGDYNSFESSLGFNKPAAGKAEKVVPVVEIGTPAVEVEDNGVKKSPEAFLAGTEAPQQTRPKGIPDYTKGIPDYTKAPAYPSVNESWAYTKTASIIDYNNPLEKGAMQARKYGGLLTSGEANAIRNNTNWDDLARQSKALQEKYRGGVDTSSTQYMHDAQLLAEIHNRMVNIELGVNGSVSKGERQYRLYADEMRRKGKYFSFYDGLLQNGTDLRHWNPFMDLTDKVMARREADRKAGKNYPDNYYYHMALKDGEFRQKVHEYALALAKQTGMEWGEAKTWAAGHSDRFDEQFKEKKAKEFADIPWYSVISALMDNSVADVVKTLYNTYDLIKGQPLRTEGVNDLLQRSMKYAGEGKNVTRGVLSFIPEAVTLMPVTGVAATRAVGALSKVFTFTPRAMKITTGGLSFMGYEMAKTALGAISRGEDINWAEMAGNSAKSFILGGGGALISEGVAGIAPRVNSTAANYTIQGAGKVAETGLFASTEMAMAYLGNDKETTWTSSLLNNGALIISMAIGHGIGHGFGFKSRISTDTIEKVRKAGYNTLANEMAKHTQAVERGAMPKGYSQAAISEMQVMQQNMGRNGLSWSDYAEVLKPTNSIMTKPGTNSIEKVKDGKGYRIVSYDVNGVEIERSKVYNEAAIDKKFAKRQREVEKKREESNVKSFDIMRESTINAKAARAVADALNQEDGKSVYNTDGTVNEAFDGITADDILNAYEVLSEKPAEQLSESEARLVSMFKQQAEQIGAGLLDSQGVKRTICERYGISEEAFDAAWKADAKDRKGKEAEACAAYNTAISRDYSVTAGIETARGAVDGVEATIKGRVETNAEGLPLDPNQKVYYELADGETRVTTAEHVIIEPQAEDPGALGDRIANDNLTKLINEKTEEVRANFAEVPTEDLEDSLNALRNAIKYEGDEDGSKRLLSIALTKEIESRRAAESDAMRAEWNGMTHGEKVQHFVDKKFSGRTQEEREELTRYYTEHPSEFDDVLSYDGTHSAEISALVDSMGLTDSKEWNNKYKEYKEDEESFRKDFKEKFGVEPTERPYGFEQKESEIATPRSTDEPPIELDGEGKVINTEQGAAPVAESSLVDVVGIPEEYREDWQRYWEQNPPKDAIDILLDRMDVMDETQRAEMRKSYEENPEFFQKEWDEWNSGISIADVERALGLEPTVREEVRVDEVQEQKEPTPTNEPVAEKPAVESINAPTEAPKSENKMQPAEVGTKHNKELVDFLKNIGTLSVYKSADQTQVIGLDNPLEAKVLAKNMLNMFKSAKDKGDLRDKMRARDWRPTVDNLTEIYRWFEAYKRGEISDREVEALFDSSVRREILKEAEGEKTGGVAKPSQPTEQAPIENKEKPFHSYTLTSGKKIEWRTQTEDKDGVKVTRVIATADGKEVRAPAARFPMPKEYEIDKNSMPENFDGKVEGIKELRESGENAAATIIVSNRDGSFDEYEVRLFKKGDAPQPENEIKSAEVPETEVKDATPTPEPAKDRIDELLDFMGLEGEERATYREHYESHPEDFDEDYSDYLSQKGGQEEPPKGEEENGGDSSQQEPVKVEDTEEETAPPAAETDNATEERNRKIDELLDFMGIEGEEREGYREGYISNPEALDEDYNDYLAEKQKEETEEAPKDEESPKEEPTTEGPAEPRIVDNLDEAMPMLDDGEPNVDLATPRRTRHYLYEESGLEAKDATDKVDYEIKKAKDAAKKAEKGEPKMSDKGIDGNIGKLKKAKQEWNDKKAAADTKLEYWNEVKRQQGLYDLIDEIGETKTPKSMADLIVKLKSRFKNDAEISSALNSYTVEPRNMYEACMLYLGSGVRFVWDSEGARKGLKQELGYGDEERSKMVGLLSKDGITVQRAVHDIVDQYGADLGFDLSRSQEVYDTLIDALSSVSTRGDVYAFINERRLNAVEDILRKRLGNGDVQSRDESEADIRANEEFETLKEQYKDELPENPTEDDVLNLMERKRQETEEPQPIEEEKQNEQEVSEREEEPAPDETGVSDDFFESGGEDEYVPFRDGEVSESEMRRDSEESKRLFDATKEKFGTTNDLREAGYILPDGTMLDFSGRYMVDDGYDTSHLRGRRAVDHRAIHEVGYDKDENETGFSTNMQDFVGRGAIRIDANAGSINLSMPPTPEQARVLQQLIARNGGDVTVDFGDGYNNEHYAEYESARATRVLGDIDRYFNEGIKPEGNLRYRQQEPMGERGVKKVTVVSEPEYREGTDYFGRPMTHRVRPGQYKVEGYDDIFNSVEEVADFMRKKNPDYCVYIDEDGNIGYEAWSNILPEGMKPNTYAKILASNGGKLSSAMKKRIERYTEREMRQARARAEEITKELGLDVEFHDDPSEFTGRKAKAKGWYDPKTGKIHIVMGNHSGVSDVMATMLHEGVAHHGLRKLFGEDFDTFLDNVHNNVSEDIRTDIDDRIEKMRAADQEGAHSDEYYRRAATEEYLADLAEDGLYNGEQNTGYASRAWQWIKENFINMLRKAGINIELSDDELRYILWSSHKNLRRGAETMAEDAVMREKAGIKDYVEDGEPVRTVAENDEAVLRNTGRQDGSVERPLFREDGEEDGGITGDLAARLRERMRQRMERARSANNGGEEPRTESGSSGGVIPPVEPPTPSAPATPEPAPELPPTDYDRPMSPIEQAQAAAIKAVNDTKASLEQRNAARRELTASLRNIHKAMGLQKEYDRATVENVVNLCKMMVQSGLIDSSYVSNLTPLFTKLKDATGKQDLTSTVNDIMDVMLKSQERSVRNEIAKLLNTKGTKVDQNGVVTQAGLDIRGQHTMKELSEYMGKGSVIIDNHISKLEEARARIPDGHQERIDDIDDKILGSQLAKQFSEIEETHSVNISEAEEDLNFLKERYKAGEIGVKEYTEQKHALENLIRSYRMAQADALWNQVNALNYVIAGSKEGTRNWIEQQKQHKSEILHNAYSDMEGASKQTQGDPTMTQKAVNMSVPKFFSSSLYTLQTMLKSLGNKHALGEGYLYNRFFRGWMEQRDAEITEYRDDMNELNSKAKELTGHSYFGIYDMIQKLPKMTVEYMDGGEMLPHELDQGQLGYAYMVNKMEDGAAALRNMGITEEKMQEISNFLNPKLKEFYDWLQDDFLAGKWEGMNEVHKRLFGADMDRVANYIPLRRDRGAGTQKVDISQENEQPLQSTVVGSIIQRVHSNLGIDLKHNNAIDVVANHLLEATHWKHFSEWKRDANTLLSDTTFRNKVKNTTTIYGSGDVLWNRLNQVFQIAGGDYKPKAHSAGVDKAIVDMARTVNTAKVSMRVFTATKQLLSLPVFASECNTAVLLKNLGFLLSPVTSKNVAQNSFLWCLQNLPQFRERWVSRTAGETRLENGDLGWGYSRQKVLEAAGRIGLTPNAFIDVCTVAAGAKSIYEKRFAQYKKDGYSVDAADKKAKIDAETAFNESQQSSEKAFVSPIQVDRTAVALGLSTFRNASMGFERKFVDAIRNFRHLTDHKETMEFMKKQMERDGLTETQAKDAAERLYRRALWRSTLNFLMFGFGAQMAWNVGGKLPYLIFGDDDEEKKKIVDQAAIHAGIGGWIEGLPAGDMLSEGMTNWAMNLIESGNPLEGNSFFEFDPDLLTVTSDFVKMTKALEGKNPLKGATDFVNLLAQIYTGVNPQTFTDAGVAIYDACDGNPEVGNEALMCILRIMQCPQSQLDQMYIDELKMSAREAQKLTPEEVARRYAYYKAHKDTPYMWWMYNQDKKDEIVKKYEGDFNKKLNTDVKEEGGTPEDYHDLSESATTEKKTLEYRSKEIDALSAQGPEALMKAWEKERDKGAAADYKYMKSLMTRYQKDVYGKGKTPTDEDEAELYQETHGEDIKEQAQKIGRDLGFGAQDSFFQMSQYKAKHTSAKDPAMKKLSDNSGGFRYSEKGKFFDINDYQIKKPVKDAAKRANVEKVVKENRELLKRNYRNGWRMARIKALYKDIEAEIAEGKEGFERDKVKKNFEEILYILEDERRDAAEWERTHPKVKFTKKIETY